MGWSTDYYTWVNHFNSNTDYMQQTKTYFHENAKKLGLSKAKSIISIGAGGGLLDAYIIKNCTPELQRYIGVEPDESTCDTLKETMSACMDGEVIVVNDRLPGWTGPAESVDIITFNHVLYFISDHPSVLRECYKWLKPGGSIIITHNYDDNIFIQMGKKQNSRCDHMHVNDCEKVKESLIEAGLPYYEDSKFVTHMTSDFMNEDLLKLYFKTYIKDLPDEQATALINEFKEKTKITCGEFLQTVGCIQINKPVM